MAKLIENQDLVDQVSVNELESLEGGCEVFSCYVFECIEAGSDEDNGDNVTF